MRSTAFYPTLKSICPSRCQTIATNKKYNKKNPTTTNRAVDNRTRGDIAQGSGTSKPGVAAPLNEGKASTHRTDALVILRDATGAENAKGTVVAPDLFPMKKNIKLLKILLKILNIITKD